MFIYPKSVILCKGRNIEWPWNREFGFYDLHQNRKVWHPHHCWRCLNLCQFLTPLTCEQEDTWNPPLRAVTYPLPRVGVPLFFSTSFHQPEHRKVVMDGSTITMTQNMLTMQKVATGTLRPWNSSCCNRVFGSFSSADFYYCLPSYLKKGQAIPGKLVRGGSASHVFVPTAIYTEVI